MKIIKYKFMSVKKGILTDEQAKEILSVKEE